MNYYFLGKGYQEDPFLIKILKAKDRDNANKIVERDTAMKGYSSAFWDKWGVILSTNDMKFINKKITEFLNK